MRSNTRSYGSEYLYGESGLVTSLKKIENRRDRRREIRREGKNKRKEKGKICGSGRK